MNSNNTAVFVLRLEIGLLLKHTCNLLIVSWSVTFVLIDSVDEFFVCSLVCFYCILSQQVSSLTCGSMSLCGLSRSEFSRAICTRARNFCMLTRRVSIQENNNSRKQQMCINLANLFNARRSVASKVDDREVHGLINFQTSPSSLKSRLIHDVDVVGAIIPRMCPFRASTTTEQVQQSM